MANSKTGKSNKLNSKDISILRFLKEREEGVRVETISKLLNLPQRTAYNHLTKLSELGFIENMYPIWKICQNKISSENWQSLLKSNKTQQGHKFSFILPLIKKPPWWNKRKDRLIKLKEWHYKKDVLWGNNPYEQITKDSMQIQTYRNSIYFINQKEYFGTDPYEIFNQAKDDVLEAIRFLEEKFKFKFIAEGNEHLTISTEHLVNIKDALSKHCKQVNERFQIKTPEGYSLWVDFSEPFGTESNSPEVMRLYLKELKDRVTHPELPVSSEIWQITAENSQGLNILIKSVNSINEQQKSLPVVINQLSEQIASHLKLIQEYRKENVSWRKEKVKEIKKELKYGHQTNLKEFF